MAAWSMTQVRLIALALAFAQSSCSLTLQRPPTPLPLRGHIECDSNLAFPGLDVLGAIGSATIAIFLATRSSKGGMDAITDRDPVVAGVFGGASLAYLGAAIYGVNVSQWCERAIDKMSERELSARRLQFDAQRAAVRKKVIELSKEAASASRGGDCGTARRIDPELRVLDREFYDAVFARDVGIRRCLDTK